MHRPLIPPALGFWIYDFGLTLPLMIALVGVVVWRMWGTVAEGKSRKSRRLTHRGRIGKQQITRSEMKHDKNQRRDK